MARLYLLFFLLQIVLAIFALISCLSVEEEQIRTLPRIVWVFIILLFPLLGALAWFFAGRVARSGGPGIPRLGVGLSPRPRPRPLAPDDDPEFLRSLEEQSKQQDQEMFRQWEEDLRRRERDLRRREGEPPREGHSPEP